MAGCSSGDIEAKSEMGWIWTWKSEDANNLFALAADRESISKL